MSKQKEIDNAISKEKALFYGDKYKGSVPDNFIALFCKSIFCFAGNFANIPSVKLKQIKEKPVADLTFVEVAKMAEIILSAPMDKIYSNLNEALEENAKIETLLFNINKVRVDFEERTEKKRDSLYNLGGVNGGNVIQNGGMKIIAEA